MREKRPEVGAGGCGKGMKLELVVDPHGIPAGVVTAPADVHEVHPAGPALASIPAEVTVPWDVPVLADRAYDSDPLRAELAEDGYRLLPRTAATGCIRRPTTGGA